MAKLVDWADTASNSLETIRRQPRWEDLASQNSQPVRSGSTQKEFWGVWYSAGSDECKGCRWKRLMVLLYLYSALRLLESI